MLDPSKNPETSHLIIVCQTTFPSVETAAAVCKMVIDRHFAACAQISSPIHALYHWNGTLETSQEVIVTLKTNEATLAKLQQFVEQNHPYELPQFIWFPANASKRFAHWIHANAIDR